MATVQSRSALMLRASRVNRAVSAEEPTRRRTLGNCEPGWAGRTSTSQPAGPRPTMWRFNWTRFVTASSARDDPGVRASTEATDRAAIQDRLGIVSDSFRAGADARRGPGRRREVAGLRTGPGPSLDPCRSAGGEMGTLGRASEALAGDGPFLFGVASPWWAAR